MTDPDDLEPLLAPRPQPAPRPGFDAALFARTERALARGRQLRRAGRAAVVAGVFVVGGLAGWELRPEPRVELVPVAEVVTVPVVVPVPVPAESAPVAVAPAEPTTAAAAELLAEQADDPARAARLYRLAGDRFLLDAQDFRNARRCYRLSLARAGVAGLSPAADDSWLLADLKVSLQKERDDATKNDGF
jgi:hypothetical protein